MGLWVSARSVCSAGAVSARLILGACLLIGGAVGSSGGAANTARPEERGGEGGAQRPARIGIKEQIPFKYRKKYLRWKGELLSTEAGRGLWRRFAEDEEFNLTIAVSQELGGGGLVDGYVWNSSGKLVAAKIILGGEFDDGALSPFYYPVTGALTPANEPWHVSGDVLAAAKLAHEFGHVISAAAADPVLYQNQNRLMEAYLKIFRENGYKARDPRLADLSVRLDGTPAEIRRWREYDAEAHALSFLRERVRGEVGNDVLLKKIRKAIEEYADGHIKLSD